MFLQVLAVCKSLQLFDLCIGQFSIHIRTVRQFTQLLYFLQFFQASLHGALHPFRQILSVIAANQCIQIISRIIVLTFLQPFRRPGKASRIAGQIQDMLLQHALPASRAEILHTSVELL